MPPRSSPLHPAALGHHLRLAGRALRAWTGAQLLVAAVVAVLVAVVIGVATVLIPNPVFSRDIPPVWWNYPVWLLTSALSGLLVATYVRQPTPVGASLPTGDPDGRGPERVARRSSRFGMAGGVLAWFAVGCPVCNKIALLALGYSGAITWFAPIQPVLGIVALVLTGVALIWRLSGQVVCPVSRPGLAVSG